MPVTSPHRCTSARGSMSTSVWVLCTCVPEESRPCLPEVFATEAAARAGYDRALRDKWAAACPEDDETGARMPYPGDPDEATRILAPHLGPRWGQWELTHHFLPAASGEA